MRQVYNTAVNIQALDNIHVADDLIEHEIKATHMSVYTPSWVLSRYTTEWVLEKKVEGLEIKVERPYRLVGLEDGLIAATFEN
ncbi:hypothetical protein AX14_000685 [Amanita brunnescens Koide BX004]|nr:hypothetical protein AX14_000685 [Amanita brunnescens Koide BX004]